MVVKDKYWVSEVEGAKLPNVVYVQWDYPYGETEIVAAFKKRGDAIRYASRKNNS